MQKSTITLLKADEGKWITDGESYGKMAFIAEGAENYREITNEEYQAEMKKREMEESI